MEPFHTLVNLFCKFCIESLVFRSGVVHRSFLLGHKAARKDNRIPLRFEGITLYLGPFDLCRPSHHIPSKRQNRITFKAKLDPRWT